MNELETGLETFLKSEEKKVQTLEVETVKHPTQDWDGKDFRGELCTPQSVAMIKTHPFLFKWLRNRPKNYINNVSSCIKYFTKYANIDIEKWIRMDKKAARDLLWDYIESIKMRTPSMALNVKALLSAAYLYYNEDRLVFIPQKHEIIYEKKVMPHLSKEDCWAIIHGARRLRDQAMFTVLLESGIRRNTIGSLNYGHYLNFMWFKEDQGKVTRSDSQHGNIALFKVVSKKDKTGKFVHDKKLRGKGISWYYACLHKEATDILRRYVTLRHQDSSEDTPLWRLIKGDKSKRLTPSQFYLLFKDAVKRAGVDSAIKPHSFRKACRGVLRNTEGITDDEFREGIMGHKLKGSAEHYFDKDPLEFAIQYAKCNFAPETKLNDEIKKLREEIEMLKRTKENKMYNGDGELEEKELQKWEAQYLNDVLETKTPKSEPNRHTKPIQKAKVVMEPITGLRGCPYDDNWVTQVDCDKCQKTRYQVWSDCYNLRRKAPNNTIFKPSKPKAS